ncbi:MAG TPA: hypothetical protein VI146_06405 [Nitrososphaeraceae archaeon]
MSESKRKKATLPLSPTSDGQNPLILSFQIVFSKLAYIVFAASTAIAFSIISSIFDQLLFFYPILVFYLPSDAIVGFILANIIAVLLGIVVSMNVYVFRHSKIKIRGTSLLSASSLSVLSSICVSCSSLGFFLISVMGTVGVAVSAFVSNYQTPLRLLSIALLIWAYYSVSNKLTKSCIKSYSNSSK